MLTIHHLKRSQSERIVWLCEELGLNYTLVLYDRESPVSRAPSTLRAVHFIGTSPIIVDGEVILAESGAIVQYILTKYGHGRLSVSSSDPTYTDYIFWLHHANGGVQPTISAAMLVRTAGCPEDSPAYQMMKDRLGRSLGAMDSQLKKFEYLAGNDLTAADCMTVFSLTTTRLIMPYSLEAYPNILAYLKRIGERDAYQRAMRECEPGMKPVMQGTAPVVTLF